MRFLNLHSTLIKYKDGANKPKGILKDAFTFHSD